jgi:tetratricopeptide (TPR) repeat protein
MGPRRTSIAVAATLVLSLGAREAPAHAAPPAPSSPSATSPSGAATVSPAVSPEARAQAQQHFQRARELYNAGSYRDAIVELEDAHTLDPTAKDLVYNLALVNEKLGRIDEALKYMHLYLDRPEMNLEPAERTRAEGAIRRLEGAKQQTAPTPAPTVAPAPTVTAPPPEPGHGRIDALTIGAATIAVGGFVVGTVFGIQAMGDKPQPGTVTQSPGSYAELERQGNDAHDKAIIADIGFGIGIVATIGTAILYFARTKPTAAASPKTGKTGVTLRPGAGALFLGGTF